MIFSLRLLNSSPAFLSTFWEGCHRDLANRDVYELPDVFMVAIFRVKYLQAVEHNAPPPVVVINSWGSTATLLQIVNIHSGHLCIF